MLQEKLELLGLSLYYGRHSLYHEHYSLSAELSQLTVTAANMTMHHVFQLVAVHHSPPQSSWAVCMGSSSTLLTWLHYNTLECWNESKHFPQFNKTLFLSIATHLYSRSASCREFYTQFISTNVGIFTTTTYETLWQDALTKIAVWNSGRSSSRPSCRMDSHRVCVWASDGRECE